MGRALTLLRVAGSPRTRSKLPFEAGTLFGENDAISRQSISFRPYTDWRAVGGKQREIVHDTLPQRVPRH